MQSLLKALKEQAFDGISQMLTDFYSSLAEKQYLTVHSDSAIIHPGVIVQKEPDIFPVVMEICSIVQAYSTRPIIEAGGFKVKGQSVFGKSNLAVDSKVGGRKVNFVSIDAKDGVVDSIRLLLQRVDAESGVPSADLVQETIAKYAKNRLTPDVE